MITEIRWHGRGGQGAKTASHLLAVATLQAGRYVQAFPEYGPERSGAPMRAYNRSDDRPIRRRYGVLAPDAVVVLDASLLEEVDVTAGLRPDGLLLVNTDDESLPARLEHRFPGRVLAIPGDQLAVAAGTRFSNVVMVGAIAAARGEPPLAALQQAVRNELGERLAPAALAATLAALDAGYQAAARSAFATSSAHA